MVVGKDEQAVMEEDPLGSRCCAVCCTRSGSSGFVKMGADKNEVMEKDGLEIAVARGGVRVIVGADEQFMENGELWDLLSP